MATIHSRRNEPGREDFTNLLNTRQHGVTPPPYSRSQESKTSKIDQRTISRQRLLFKNKFDRILKQSLVLSCV